MNLQNILNKWGIKCDIKTILNVWSEGHRYYHDISHLDQLLQSIEKNKKGYTEEQYEQLILVALFHDIVYNPEITDNEEKSADMFLSMCIDKQNPKILEIYNAILDTKTHTSNSWLSVQFNKFDMSIVESDFEDLVDWEEGIANEFIPVYGVEKYKNGRLSFLNGLLDKYPLNSDNLMDLIDYVKTNYNEKETQESNS